VPSCSNDEISYWPETLKDGGLGGGMKL
jgi:hypothetical protein